VDHIGGHVAGQEPGSEGGGVDIVEAGFGVQKEGGDFQSWSPKGFYHICKGEAGVGGADSREGAALVWVEVTCGSGDGGESDCHHSFKDLRYRFEEDDDSKGGGRVVGGFAGFGQDHSVGVLQSWGVVPEFYLGGEEFEDDRGIDMVYLSPYGVGDPTRAWSISRGALGEGESNLFLGKGGGGGVLCQATPAR